MNTQALDVIDTAGIAELLGITRDHARNRIVKLPGFPKPTIDVSQKIRAWDRDEVIAFLKKPKKRRA